MKLNGGTRGAGAHLTGETTTTDVYKSESVLEMFNNRNKDLQLLGYRSTRLCVVHQQTERSSPMIFHVTIRRISRHSGIFRNIPEYIREVSPRGLDKWPTIAGVSPWNPSDRHAAGISYSHRDSAVYSSICWTSDDIKNIKIIYTRHWDQQN